jgi:hypothetical protein
MVDFFQILGLRRRKQAFSKADTMIFHGKQILGALGLALLSAGGASALTTVSDGQAVNGAAPPIYSGPGETVNVSFSWSSTPGSAYVEVTATQAFNLFLTGYGSAPIHEDYTGFILREIGGASLTTDHNFCSGSALAELQVSCNLATNFGGTAFHQSHTPDAVVPVLSNIAAGSYYLGFYEGATPADGSVSFSLVTAVPVPAGGMLLLGALGGLGLLRRRSA